MVGRIVTGTLEAIWDEEDHASHEECGEVVDRGRDATRSRRHGDGGWRRAAARPED